MLAMSCSLISLSHITRTFRVELSPLMRSYCCFCCWIDFPSLCFHTAVYRIADWNVEIRLLCQRTNGIRTGRISPSKRTNHHIHKDL